jgi:hypothetical protein
MEGCSEEVFKALTGIKQDLFYHLYVKYCGPGTPVCKSVRPFARDTLLCFVTNFANVHNCCYGLL